MFCRSVMNKIVSNYSNNSCKLIKNCRSISTTSKRCRAEIIDGKKIAMDIKNEVKVEIDAWIAAGNRRPKLAAVIVGSDPASQTYIRNKMKAAQYTGIESETMTLPESVSEKELLTEIQQLNDDSTVDGLIVQLPVPPHIRERAVMNAVLPEKDVDGFHVLNIGRFCSDLMSLVPATPAGVIEMIKRTGVETFGKNAVVCGRSKNVGMPIAMLLHADGIGETDACDATTTICHRYTPREHMIEYTKRADIVVTATGIPGLITPDIIKEGACIIDVGINRVKDPKTGKTRLVGDADFDGCVEKAGYITPVPGGVGPMTVAMLMKNTLTAAKRQVKYEFH